MTLDTRKYCLKDITLTNFSPTISANPCNFKATKVTTCTIERTQGQGTTHCFYTVEKNDEKSLATIMLTV